MKLTTNGGYLKCVKYFVRKAEEMHVKVKVHPITGPEGPRGGVEV
jgi:hypothetical protein